MKRFILLLFIIFSVFTFTSYADVDVGQPQRGRYGRYDDSAGKLGYLLKGTGHGVIVETSKELDNLSQDYEVAVRNQDTQKMGEIRTILRKNSDKVVDMLAGEYTFDNLFERARQPLYKIASLLYGVANYLLSVLTALEIILAIIESPTKFPVDVIFERLVRWGFLKFIILNWLELIAIFKKFAVVVAKYASGAGQVLVSPEKTWIVYGTPILNTWEDLNWMNIGYILVCLVGTIIVAMLVVDLFMAELEFYVLVGFSVILLPFMAWKKTEGVGGKVMGVVGSQVTRLMFMYFFLTIGTNLLPNTGPFSFKALDSLTLFAKYIAILYVLKIFVSKAPAFASAMMSGGTAMSGRDINSPAMNLASQTVGTALGVVSGAVGLAIAYKNLKANKNVGNIASKLGGAANPNKKDD